MTITSVSELNYSELARLVAAKMSSESLLSAEDIGAMLGYPARYIRETIAFSPGFPQAIRLKLSTTGKRSFPRWRRSDVEKWVHKHHARQRLRKVA